MDGVMYFPTGEVTFSGGSSVDPTNTMIIADMIKFAGNTEFGTPESSTAQNDAQFVTVTLVE